MVVGNSVKHKLTPENIEAIERCLNKSGPITVETKIENGKIVVLQVDKKKVNQIMVSHIALGYAIETESGVMPIEGYTVIEGIVCLSDPDDVIQKCDFESYDIEDIDEYIDTWNCIIRKYNDAVKENKKCGSQ